jgi:periplasmic protein TonB
MHLETWSTGESDPERAKRLAIGYAVGIAMFAAVALIAARMSGAIKPPEDDDLVEVKLATQLPEAPPAPPPPPPPDRPPPAPGPKGPPKKVLVAPTAVPTEAPPEADPSKAKPESGGDDAYGEPGGVPGGVPGGTGTGTAAAAPPPPPPPPPPAPKARGPVQLPENATPPVALGNAQPGYPPEARSAGVEAVVIVKFVVTETGEVANVTVVRGHPMFDATVLAMVKSWRFKPAIADGKPIAVYRMVRFPFKFKT